MQDAAYGRGGPAPQGSDLNGPGRTLYEPTAPIRQPLKKLKEEKPPAKAGGLQEATHRSRTDDLLIANSFAIYENSIF